jgi:hypothetical protein
MSENGLKVILQNVNFVPITGSGFDQASVTERRSRSRL